MITSNTVPSCIVTCLHRFQENLGISVLAHLIFLLLVLANVPSLVWCRRYLTPYILSSCHVQFDDKVTEYRGIVAQSLQLLHTGDHVELDVPWEV